jgi:hypothetical protein
MTAFTAHSFAAAIVAACIATTACIAPAWAGGPIEVRRDKLPKPIARLHICVQPGDIVETSPEPTPVGRSGVLFEVTCPADGEGVRALQSAETPARDPHFALYLARNKAGVDARRLSFQYPQANGQESRINVVPAIPSVGWSTREHTSKLNGAAFFDMQRPQLPANEFHLMVSFKPADRPDLKGVVAIWRVTARGETALIYWAETAEELRGEYPHWIYPQYKVVLDRRPER